MKRSRIALLAMGGVLAAVVIASVVSARIALSPGSSAPADAQSFSGGTKLELHGFRGIEVAGRWRVEVSQGDDWRVELSYPEGIEDRVKVYLRGDRLRLDLDAHAWWDWDEASSPASADIVMPELEELELWGASRLDLGGFRGRRLEINIAGTTRIEGRDGRYDELDLSVAGAGNVDLRGVTVTDAEVDLAGASRVTLTMNGGELSGSMAGTGSVLYYGAVSRETVSVAGLARVDHAE